MYNNTNTNTGSAVGLVTKDVSVRLHHPSVRKKTAPIAIAQWHIRTLLDREATDRSERHTALVALELAKCSIVIVLLSKTRFHASGCLNDLEYTFYWSNKPEGE